MFFFFFFFFFIFYRISELMLATLIQTYDKKSFHFKAEGLTEILKAVSVTFYDCNSFPVTGDYRLLQTA